MQVQGPMGLMAMQEDSDADNGNMGQAEDGQHEAPPGQISKPLSKQGEHRVKHEVMALSDVTEG
ncbi:uncharacterized protein FOKN1_3039 [Thiohalobacter thiocyanaticus]|uniref:Uncharacterized protein n=1 Tax=Thiohalobacter thiocyanaticus TaxID=585455 RepID=A0A1Z4VUU6_9GAMM|nr:uncharacterized protein FOKN1_3039 [Thiohalobacter thiocyanaticus]